MSGSADKLLGDISSGGNRGSAGCSAEVSCSDKDSLKGWQSCRLGRAGGRAPEASQPPSRHRWRKKRTQWSLSRWGEGQHPGEVWVVGGEWFLEVQVLTSGCHEVGATVPASSLFTLKL